MQGEVSCFNILELNHIHATERIELELIKENQTGKLCTYSDIFEVLYD
jgi:hypothetical protein